MRKKTTPKSPKPKVDKEKIIPNDSPRYIDINEDQGDSRNKNRKLWLIVIVFSAVLIVVWLAVLKITVAEEAKKIGFNQISEEINGLLAGFDKTIKTNQTTAIDINADDIEKIKNDLEQQLKNNPDSSLWPNHQISDLKISLSYPEDWQKTETGKIITLTDQASSTGNGYGKITISAQDNKSGYDLNAWLAKTKTDLAGYELMNSVFKFSSSTDLLVFAATESPAAELQRLYYLNSPANKKVYELKAEALGDLDYYSPLINEIISTIR